jgi:hypothetical protein
LHGAAPLFLFDRHRQPTLAAGVALSYFHSDRSGQSFSSLAKRALAAQWRNLSSIPRVATKNFFSGMSLDFCYKKKIYARGFVRLAPFGQSCLNRPSSIFRFFITLV